MALFDRKLPIRIPYLELLSWVTSTVIASGTGASTDKNTTSSDRHTTSGDTQTTSDDISATSDDTLASLTYVKSPRTF